MLFACQDEHEEAAVGAWFGGQIVNPTTDVVILTKNDEVLDTLSLDADNRFLYYVEPVEKGIYNFIHNEYQIIFLEPGDSLLIHINTAEFDESLAFSGRGARRNNFLINLFLDHKRESQEMPRYYNLEAGEFLRSADSMRQRAHKKLNRFVAKKKVCSDFRQVAEASIDYNYYLRREMYPFVYYGFAESDRRGQLPADYYHFRKRIDYNDTSLQAYYPYTRFMNFHFDYVAFEAYKNEQSFDRDSYLHNQHKLQLINTQVPNEFLKNKLLRSTIRNYAFRAKTINELTELQELYATFSTQAEHKQEIEALIRATQVVMPGMKLPNLPIHCPANNNSMLAQTIVGPTVLYFWMPAQPVHHKNTHAKIAELRNRYPEFNFIGVTMDTNQTLWKRTIERNHYDKTFEYSFNHPESAIETLVLNSLNQVFIVDKDGIIIDNHANLFTSGFEEQLVGYLSSRN